MQNGAITDMTRIKAALPTIKDLQARGAQVIVMSHLGRPKGVDQSLSLRPVAQELGRALWTEVKFAYDCVGPQAQSAVGRMQAGQVLVLENVRFHPEDEANDPQFAQQLASEASCLEVSTPRPSRVTVERRSSSETRESSTSATSSRVEFVPMSTTATRIPACAA